MRNEPIFSPQLEQMEADPLASKRTHLSRGLKLKADSRSWHRFQWYWRPPLPV